MDLLDDDLTTGELLDGWRDAIRAAELAERLAEAAAEAVSGADIHAVEAEKLADLADSCAPAVVTNGTRRFPVCPAIVGHGYLPA